jgi:outer membrane immunogenic protein
MSAAAIAVLATGDLAVAQPALYNWTGFYVGVNTGVSLGHGAPTYNEPVLGSFGLPTSISGSSHLNGVIGGFQAGYSWQFNNTWVAGLETDFQGTSEKASSNFNFPYTDCESAACNLSGTLSSKILWFGTLRAQLGWLVTPTTMIYGTGGLAYGRVNVSGSFSDDFCTPACTWRFDQSAMKTGWAAGGGIKGLVLNSRNLVWKFEYLHVDLGSISGSGIDTDFVGPYYYSAKFTDDILRIGLEWNFH